MQKYECVVAYNSFQPLLFYYLTRIKEWGLQFHKCRICGRDFLAYRIRKLKKESVPEDIIAKAVAAFEVFRSDGVKLKGELEFDDFKRWIDG